MKESSGLSRFHFVVLFVTLFLISESKLWPNAQAATDRPNILVILADDLGYGDVQCFNLKSRIPTPHLNQMAAEGSRFIDAHSPSTVCTPTATACSMGDGFSNRLPRRVHRSGGPCLIEADRLTLGGMRPELGLSNCHVG